VYPFAVQFHRIMLTQKTCQKVRLKFKRSVLFIFNFYTFKRVYVSAPILQPAIVFKQLKIEGFIFGKWTNMWKSGIERNLNLIKEVRLLFIIRIIGLYKYLF